MRDRQLRKACGVSVNGFNFFFPNQHGGFFLCVLIMRVLRDNPKHLLTFARVACCGFASTKVNKVRGKSLTRFEIH